MSLEEKRKGSVTGDNPTGTGKRIGDYVLGETLGQGSFGKVKLATNARTKEKVAIKIVEKSTISDVEDVERVYRETFILTTLKHQNIVRLHEVIDTPTALCLAMDYADGGELYDYVNNKGRLDEIEACRLFHEIVAGVEYCHRMKIIHRDLKLENILMHEGSVKIADFGLSNTIKFGQKMNTNCGTPAYTCPEQIMGKKYIGSAADIWSMGIILYGMVCGFLPFEANGIPALFRKIKTRQFKHAEYVTKECCALIDRMLTIDPEKRATLSEIRSHAWYLQDYNPELIDRIEAVGTISPETIALAHRDCMECSSEDATSTDRAGYSTAQPAPPSAPNGTATVKARGSMFPTNGAPAAGVASAKQRKGAPAAKTATQRAREDRERLLFEQQQHQGPSLFAPVNREDSGRALGFDRPSTGPAKKGLSRPGSVTSAGDPEETGEYSDDTYGSIDDSKEDGVGAGGNRSLFVDTEQEDDPEEDELEAAATVRRRVKGRTISINTNVLGAGNRAHSPKSGDFAKFGDRTPLSGGIGLPNVNPSPNNKGGRSPLTPSNLMGMGGARPSTSSHATKTVSPMGLSPLNANAQSGAQAAAGAFFAGNTLQPLSPMAPFHQRKASNGTPINLPSPNNASAASPKARKSIQPKGGTPKSLDMSMLGNGSMSPKNSPQSPTTPNAGRVRASVMLFEARAETNSTYSPNQRGSAVGPRPPSGVTTNHHGRDSPNPNKGYAVHLPPIAAGSSRDLIHNPNNAGAGANYGTPTHGGFGKSSGSPRYSLEADKDSRDLGALNYGLGTLKREAGRGSLNSAFNNLIGALESTTGSGPLNSALGGLPSALAPEHSMKVRVPRTPRASTLDGKERDSFVGLGGYGDKDIGLSGGAMANAHYGGANAYIESRAPAVLRVSSEPAGSVT